MVSVVTATVCAEHADSPDGPWEPWSGDLVAVKRYVRAVMMYGDEPGDILSIDREEPEPIIVECEA